MSYYGLCAFKIIGQVASLISLSCEVYMIQHSRYMAEGRISFCSYFKIQTILGLYVRDFMQCSGTFLTDYQMLLSF